MDTNTDRLTLTVLDDIRLVDADEWDSLARQSRFSPFLEYGFLASLEASGCVGEDSGWYPRHFLLKSDDRLVAAAPVYARTHSMGEFIFDQGLAQAAESMGQDYYPKLVATLPFTPAPGYRFLIHSDYPEDSITAILLQGMEQYTERAGLHSVSVLFADPEWTVLPGVMAADSDDNLSDSTQPSPRRWLRWIHQYFLWENRNYLNFDDFTARFDKNQRRNIRRERASVKQAGIEIDVIRGCDADETILDRMYQLYEKTNDQFGPWAAFFLNREWFHEVCRQWGDRILFFTARRPDEPQAVALSMVVRKDDTLTGRYWGTLEFVPNLHFELCYYAPLEYAIKEGLKWFDPGMGSPHKARRGFESREFSTWHRFRNPETASLFSSVLPEANIEQREAISSLNKAVPWKTD